MSDETHPFSPHWCYLTPDGRRFLVLSCDYERRIVRLFWMHPLNPNNHKDVPYDDLAGSTIDGKPTRPARKEE